MSFALKTYQISARNLLRQVCHPYTALQHDFFSLKTGKKKNQRKKNTKMAVFSLKYHTAVRVGFVIFDTKNENYIPKLAP